MFDFFGALAQAFSLLFSFDPELYQIMLLSIYVSGMATILASLSGIPLGAIVALKRFRGKTLTKSITYMLMGLPSVVVGLFVYLMISHSGPFGALNLLYTPTAIIIAQFILAFPVVMGIAISAVASVPPEISDVALSLGATDWQVTVVVIKEARIGLATAIITGFSTCISEVAAAMMVGGNIEYSTRVLTTATMLETEMGDFSLAMALGIILLILVFIVNIPLIWVQRARKTRIRKPVVATL
jgi:tungstate transport system permease protein